MAIAKSLPEVGMAEGQIHPLFMQDCPFCGRSNRIVMHGLFVLGDKIQKHPDMGYSFCNCKNMFYTNRNNVWDENGFLGPHNFPENGVIILPDPFFAWPDPYEFRCWDVRRYQIIWPIDSLCEYFKEQGYEILSADRDFDLHSKTPQHYHVKVRKL